jgi:hypothetical protein
MEHKTLGTWKSAARDQVKQVSILTDKSNEYSCIIMASPVSRQDNWTAYYVIYLPRMTFVLPTSYLLEGQLYKIDQRAISATFYAKEDLCLRFQEKWYSDGTIWWDCNAATDYQTTYTKNSNEDGQSSTNTI